MNGYSACSKRAAEQIDSFFIFLIGEMYIRFEVVLYDPLESCLARIRQFCVCIN